MAQVSADKLENPPVLHQREARRDTRDPRLLAGDAEQGAGGKSLVTHSEPRAPLLVSTLLLARGSKAALHLPRLMHSRPMLRLVYIMEFMSFTE